MSRNPVIQSPKDQFLHWCQVMEKKQEEQPRRMRELQDRTKHLQHDNDRLQAQVEERHNLGEGDAQDSRQAKHPTLRDKGKKPITPDNVDTPADDELSSDKLPNPSPVKSSRARSHQRHSHRPAFSNTNNGLLCQARRETGREQSHPNGTPRPHNAFARNLRTVAKARHDT